MIWRGECIYGSNFVEVENVPVVLETWIMVSSNHILHLRWSHISRVPRFSNEKIVELFLLTDRLIIIRLDDLQPCLRVSCYWKMYGGLTQPGTAGCFASKHEIENVTADKCNQPSASWSDVQGKDHPGG